MPFYPFTNKLSPITVTYCHFQINNLSDDGANCTNRHSRTVRLEGSHKSGKANSSAAKKIMRKKKSNLTKN